MKHNINIAIFGLSLTILDELKNKIRLMFPDEVTIHWTNIAEPNLDCVLVNDIFFSSSNIQNLIQNKQLRYLRLVKNPEHGGSIVGDALALPLDNLQPLTQWFHQQVLYAPSTQPTAAPVQTPTTPTPSKVSFNTILDEIFNEKNGNLQLFDATGKLAIINARSERAWVIAQRLPLTTDHTFNYTYATAQDVKEIENNIALDLRSWLFNLAWHSQGHLKQPVDLQKFYKLIFWPQAEYSTDRKNIVKIAACFAKGARIDQVANHLNVPIPLIETFVSACQVAKLIEEIPANDAKLIKVHVQPATPQQTVAVKSFFGRLRQRLGL